MNQREAAIEAMLDNGGYAALDELYKRALKVPGVIWETLYDGKWRGKLAATALRCAASQGKAIHYLMTRPQRRQLTPNRYQP